MTGIAAFGVLNWQIFLSW